MNNKQIRWGILGAGRIADKFCTALVSTPRAILYAVASRNTISGKPFSEKFSSVKFYDNYLDLVSDPNVDIVYIATPHIFHYEQVKLCLEHNKPVLCEKPIGVSFLQTQKMIELAIEKKLFLMEGMWTACMPVIKKIQEIIAEGLIGTISNVQADIGFTAPNNPVDRLLNKDLAGGSILDVGVYPISLATLLLGEPSVIKSISALTETGVDAYSNIILQYPSGATAQLLSSLTFETPKEVVIMGTKGLIKVDAPWFMATDFTVIFEDGSENTYSIPHPNNGFEYEIIEVMDCLIAEQLESHSVPHSQTLIVSKIMDELLLQAGVCYEQSL